MLFKASIIKILFSLVPSKITLTRETDAKKPEQFKKLLLWNAKIDQNIKFAKLPKAKWLFCKVEIILEQREVAFLSPNKIFSVLKLFLL